MKKSLLIAVSATLFAALCIFGACSFDTPEPQGCQHTLSFCEQTAAACEKEGSLAHWRCTKCGKLFEDGNGAKEIAASAVAIPPTGHSPITRIGRAATCIREGTVETVCSVCGDVVSTRSYADASAHDWGQGVKTGNVTTYTCQNDDSHVRKAIVSDMGASDFTKEELSDVDEVTVSGVSVSFDTAAEASLPAGALSLSVEVVAESEVPQAVKEKIAGDVYAITLSNAAGAITALGGGKATVRLPYSPKAGDDLSALIVYYIDGETLEPIPADYTGGHVVFETAHFAQYAVGMYEGDVCKTLGHAVFEKRTEPTCTEDGKIETICMRCGEVTRSDVLPARGYHAYDEDGKCADCGYQCPHDDVDDTHVCNLCH